MPKVICELENASGLINGIEFVPHEDGMRSISKDEVGEPHLSIFLSIPGYCVEGGEGGQKALEPPKEPEQPKETAKQRAARLKAEQEAADKAEADRLAEEEAQRLAAEEAAKQSEQQGAGGNTDGAGNDQGEVF